MITRSVSLISLLFIFLIPILSAEGIVYNSTSNETPERSVLEFSNSAKTCFETPENCQLQPYLSSQEIQPVEENSTTVFKKNRTCPPQPDTENPADNAKKANLYQALNNDDTDGLNRILLEGYDVNIRNELKGRTLLHIVARGRSEKMAALLLLAGAKLDITDHEGNTPYSSIGDRRKEMKTFLKNADIFFKIPNPYPSEASYAISNSDLLKAFQYAIEKNDIGTLLGLVQLGCNVNVSDPQTGETPLHFAAAKGCIDAAGILAKAGAVIEAKDTHNRSPLSSLPKRENGEYLDKAMADFLKFLIEFKQYSILFPNWQSPFYKGAKQSSQKNIAHPSKPSKPTNSKEHIPSQSAQKTHSSKVDSLSMGSDGWHRAVRANNSSDSPASASHSHPTSPETTGTHIDGYSTPSGSPRFSNTPSNKPTDFKGSVFAHGGNIYTNPNSKNSDSNAHPFNPSSPFANTTSLPSGQHIGQASNAFRPGNQPVAANTKSNSPLASNNLNTPISNLNSSSKTPGSSNPNNRILSNPSNTNHVLPPQPLKNPEHGANLEAQSARSQSNMASSNFISFLKNWFVQLFTKFREKFNVQHAVDFKRSFLKDSLSPQSSPASPVQE